jgi:hypothetical protein
MAKPKKKGGEGAKAVLYVELPAVIKGRLEELAAEHNRKLTGEVIQALQEYLEKYGRWPPAKGVK